jgi:hypothetical protein
VTGHVGGRLQEVSPVNLQVIFRVQQKFATHYAQCVLHPSLYRWLITPTKSGEDCKLWSSDVEISIVTRIRTGMPRNLVSIPGKIKILSPLPKHPCRLAVHPSSYWVREIVLQAWSRQTPHSRVEVKNERSRTSTLKRAFVGRTGTICCTFILSEVVKAQKMHIMILWVGHPAVARRLQVLSKNILPQTTGLKSSHSS